MDSQMVSKENDILIRLEDVWKVYKMGEVEVPALRGVSVEIKKGTCLAAQPRPHHLETARVPAAPMLPAPS